MAEPSTNTPTRRRTNSADDIPPRPKVVEQSSIVKAVARPEGIDLIDPLIGLRSQDPDKIAAETQARKERFEKIKSAGGGDFRVIHGSVCVPKPRDEYINADGTLKPTVKPFTTAIPGDIVRLTPEDAFRLLEQDIVEELDAKPSRLGAVFAPPKIVRQFGGMPVEAAKR
jgi:hypothetical protein